MFKMDDTDREILSILRADARTPVAVLAQKLRIARGTVQNRLRKLEDSGVITGYTVRLRPESEPQRIRAWMSIAVEGNAAPEVIRALRLASHPGQTLVQLQKDFEQVRRPCPHAAAPKLRRRALPRPHIDEPYAL